VVLPLRNLGSLSSTAIAFGCMNLSHAYNVAPPEEEAVALLNHALDAGMTMFDTAALYGGGGNERLLAKAVMHRRKEFVLASKCVLDMIDGKRVLDGRPETITASLERSLQRLGTDYIDLYYLHRLDRNVPIEESMGALVRAKEAGKIGHIGVSEISAATIRCAHAVHPLTAVQSEYSICVRNPEVAVLEACRELGIGFVAFSPLMRGLLADAVHNDAYAPGDIRHMMPRFTEPNLSTNLTIISAYNRLARDLDITPSQLALAWVLSRGDHIVALPGTQSQRHLDENLGAASIMLDSATLANIEGLFAPGALLGDRYPPQMQAQIDTELLPEEVAP